MTDFHKRTTAELQAELARINASSDRGGLVFGTYWNHGSARSQIESELAKRGVAPVVTQTPDSHAQGWPDPASVYQARAAACQQARQADDGMQMQNPNHLALGDLAEQAYAARRGN